MAFASRKSLYHDITTAVNCQLLRTKRFGTIAVQVQTEIKFSNQY